MGDISYFVFQILWQSLLIATYTAQTSPALRVTNCCKHCRTKFRRYALSDVLLRACPKNDTNNVWVNCYIIAYFYIQTTITQLHIWLTVLIYLSFLLLRYFESHNTPVSVVFSKKSFYICDVSSSSASHNILWKCFSQVLKWKCGSFLVERMTRNNTHFRIDTCGRAHSARPDIPYLSECGVLCRLFSTGSFHNLHLDKRKSAPHFLCIYI